MFVSTADQPFLKLFRQVLKKRPHLQVTYNHVEDFIDIQYGASDVYMTDVDNTFLDNFRAYLRSFNISDIEEHVIGIEEVHSPTYTYERTTYPKLPWTPSTAPLPVIDDADLHQVLQVSVNQRLRLVRKIFIIQCLFGVDAVTIFRSINGRTATLSEPAADHKGICSTTTALRTKAERCMIRCQQELSEIELSEYDAGLLDLKRVCRTKVLLNCQTAKSVSQQLMAGELSDISHLIEVVLQEN